MSDPLANDLPVVVIGAGPVGLAAAAHLHVRGLPALVLEAGAAVGNSVREWGHVRLSSPWRYVVDADVRRLLERRGWGAPDPAAHPTGAQLVRDLLEPLVQASSRVELVLPETGVCSTRRPAVCCA